jgi:hypothetical protein
VHRAAAADPDKVRIAGVDGISVVTNAPHCEVDKMLAHLGTVAAAVRADLPCVGGPAQPLMLAAKLPEVVAAVQKSGSTALEPLLPVLGLSWEQLDEQWRAFCRKTYAAE